MTISQRVGISLIASAFVVASVLPATASDTAMPAANPVVRTATVKKPPRHHPIRLVTHRPIRLVAHRPIRLVAAEWPTSGGWHVGYLVLGVGF